MVLSKKAFSQSSNFTVVKNSQQKLEFLVCHAPKVISISHRLQISDDKFFVRHLHEMHLVYNKRLNTNIQEQKCRTLFKILNYESTVI